MATQTLVPITMLALLQRINRRLAKEEKILKKARGFAGTHEFGPYYLLHWSSHTVEQMQVEPVALAKALGVLAPWERVRDEE